MLVIVLIYVHRTVFRICALVCVCVCVCSFHLFLQDEITGSRDGITDLEYIKILNALDKNY